MKTTNLFKTLTAVLFVFAATVSGFPQAAQRTSTKNLEFAGTTALNDSAPSLGISEDLKVKPQHEFDASITGIYAGPSSASVPTINSSSTSNVVTGDTKSFSGFNGLTHLDQRLAGTGRYANTQFSSEPPDQALAVGNGFVLESVNDALAVYDAKTGSVLKGPTALNQFFQLKPEIDRATGVFGDFLSDPRAYYDAQVQRWFLTVLQISIDPANGAFVAPTELLIAVSQTNDPTHGWNIFKLNTTNDGVGSCPCFGDQPLIGANSNGFYVTTNAFNINDGFRGVQLYAMSKRMLAAGSLPKVAHVNGLSLPGGFAFTVQPATSPFRNQDEAEDNDHGRRGVEYFMSIADIRNFTDNRIAVWALSNTSSLANATPSLRLENVLVRSESFTVPPDSPQKAGPTPLAALIVEPEELLATNEHRMQQVVFADGRLWSALTTAVTFSNDPNPHAGIAYFIVNPSVDRNGSVEAEIDRQGYVTVLDNDVFYPSIGVGNDGKGAMTFTLAGPSYFPSAAYTSINTKRGAGGVKIAAAGASPDDGFSGYAAFGGFGSGRWGDYSAAVADEEGSIWMAAEYIPGGPRTLLANWGTFISRLKTDDNGNEDGE